VVSRCGRVSARWPPSLALIPSAAQAQTEDTIYESLSIPTVDGDRINVEVARPKGAADAPVILTYSPYNSLSEGTSPNLAYDELGQRYLPIGYARAVADVLGTRNSSGCWDYGGREEQQSGVDLVNALAAQPRSNGRVAMIGGSYDGTTANMVAARGVDAPGLAAIVPELAISRWHGYAYWGGVRYLGNSEKPTDEGFDTPLGFDYGIARTPPTQRTPQTLDAMNDRIHPCDGLEHTLQGYDTSPDYDGLWEEGDYRKDAGEFRASTLVVHGWQDYNVKQSEGLDLYEALPMSTRASADAPFKRLYLFQGSHQSPSGRPHFDALLDEFFATTLRGEAPGPELATPVLTQGRTSAAPGDFRRRRHGRPRRKRPAARARALADGRDARRRRRPRGVVHRHGNHLRGGHPAGARRRDGLAHLTACATRRPCRPTSPSPPPSPSRRRTTRSSPATASAWWWRVRTWSGRCLMRRLGRPRRCWAGRSRCRPRRGGAGERQLRLGREVGEWVAP